MSADSIAQTGTTIVRDAGEGDAMWFNNDLLTFKAAGDETDGAFVLLEEVARRGKVTPLHTHPEETESFYVLEGELMLHIDGSDRPVGPGGFASVPPGVPHAYLVTSETARLLILLTPGSGAMTDFFRAAGEAAGERALPPETPLDIERIAAAAASTGAVDILGPPPFAEPA